MTKRQRTGLKAPGRMTYSRPGPMMARGFNPPHFESPTSADLLRVLAHCESGATEPMLNAMGFASEMLVALHDAEHIDGHVEQFAHPKGMGVNRYSITAKGRMVLQVHDGRK